MTMIDFSTIAMLYLTHTLCVLPASKETKRPTVPWKAYQNTLPTETEWGEWGRTATGICILAGKISGGLIVIDFDDKGSRFDAWCELLPEELRDKLVVVQTQSGGYHVYVRCENESIRNVKLARTEEGKTLIETRGEGGLVIAPPTPGYKILSGSFESIAVLSLAEWELLLNAAQSFDEMQKKTKPKTGNTSAEILVDMKEAVRQAIACINTMPEAVDGENGSAAAMRVANKLYEFGLDRETAKQVFLEHYNPRCLPEWSEKEVEHKLDTAYNKPLKMAGYMLTHNIVLDPKDPLASAYKFIKTVYTFNGIPTLISYSGGFWQWSKNAYRSIETDEVKNKLKCFLERSNVEQYGDDRVVLGHKAFPVKPHTLNAIAEMLRHNIFRPVSDIIPCWIDVPHWIDGKSYEKPDSVTDPSLLIFCKNMILNLEDMETLPSSPLWLNFAALDFDYDSKAECPQWIAFLDSIFGDDEESKNTLMEYMGLCLTNITKFQKALFIVGPKRSGKGTIARILQKIVGEHNTVSPATSGFGQQFGLQPLIGKTVAIVNDARFSKQNAQEGLERILNITGEDKHTINRKHRDAITLQLKTKLIIISNEIPNVLDQSGALASRFVFLKLSKSFFGQEDVELERKLSDELPGILRLVIQNLQNLLARGHFIQPESGKRLAERMTALSSPVGEFMRQLQPNMTKDEIWSEWQTFCCNEEQNPGRREVLWNALETAGYDCDFDSADILSKIKQHGDEATVQMLRDSTNRFRRKGATETLKKKLAEMVNSGILSVREKKANNGQVVEYYSIVTAAPDDSYNDDDESCVV